MTEESTIDPNEIFLLENVIGEGAWVFILVNFKLLKTVISFIRYKRVKFTVPKT